jgi:hypothetical protein
MKEYQKPLLKITGLTPEERLACSSGDNFGWPGWGWGFGSGFGWNNGGNNGGNKGGKGRR